MDKGVKTVSKQRKGAKESGENKIWKLNTKIQCLGKHDLYVEGCKGIIKYELKEIVLNGGAGQVAVLGNNLTIPVLERNFVQIQGDILEIKFI